MKNIIAEYKNGSYQVVCFESGLVEISKDGNSKTIYPTSPIPVCEWDATRLEKLGVNPENYFSSNGTIIRNAARPVIEAALKIVADREEKEKADRRARALSLLPVGYELCKREWVNGDLCSGLYAAEDGTSLTDSDLLTPLGNTGFFAISVEKLNQKREINRAQAAAAPQAKAQADEVFRVKKEQANQTGKEVLLASWTTNRCMNGNSRECSFDHAAKYVLPDGKVITRFTCCY